jgi:hypothetical protein
LLQYINTLKLKTEFSGFTIGQWADDEDRYINNFCVGEGIQLH